MGAIGDSAEGVDFIASCNDAPQLSTYIGSELHFSNMY